MTPPDAPVPAVSGSLWSDDRGAISALGVLAAAAFACLLLLVVNTGYATTDKIELQNAADAAAISGATWAARGLNIISMNNVTQTQLLAIALIIPALDRAMAAALPVLELQRAACSALLVGAPACIAVISAQIYGLTALHRVVQVADKTLGARPNGALWSAMNLLEGLSTAVGSTFVGLAEIEGDRIARQDGADLGLLVPGGLQFTLPVRKGSLSPDLCEPTHVGSPNSSTRGYAPLLGYPVGQGPLEVYGQNAKYPLYLFANSFVTVFFDFYRETQYRQLCGGSAPPPRAERAAGSVAACRAQGGGTAIWTIIQYDTRSFDTPQLGLSINGDDDPRLVGPPRAVNPPLQRPCSWTPPGRRVGADRYRSMTEVVERDRVGADGQQVPRYRYQFRDHIFLSATSPVRAPGGRGGLTPPPSRSATGGPRPHLLDSGAEDQLRYLAFLYRARPVRVAPGTFVAPLGPHRLAYAQARVYNPTSFDLFTQDWRVALEPASLIEDGSLMSALTGPAARAAGVRNGSALASFRRSSGLLDALQADLNLLRYLNNH